MLWKFFGILAGRWGSVSDNGAIRRRKVRVRSWVAVFFLLNRKTLNNRSKRFSKCLKMAAAVYKRNNCRMPGCGSPNKTNSYPGPGVVEGRRRISSLLSSHRRGNFYWWTIMMFFFCKLKPLGFPSVFSQPHPHEFPSSSQCAERRHQRHIN